MIKAKLSEMFEDEEMTLPQKLSKINVPEFADHMSEMMRQYCNQ
jgi:hypothetical protein